MKPTWTLEQIVANLARWNAAWPTSSPVDYAFYTSAPAHHAPVAGFSPFSPAQRAALSRAFDLMSDVCNLDFRQVSSNGQEPGLGNERIGFLNVNSSNYQFTGRARIDFTDPPGDERGVIRGADVEINLHRAGPRGGWGLGDWNFSTLMHEALHALGLQHPGGYNGDSGHEAGYEEAAEYLQDSGQYTVMSYWAASETGANWRGGGVLRYAATPLLHDVAALQALYGANMATRLGDTVYGFHSTAGRASYDLAISPYRVFTIWDAGGNDTLDLSGYSTRSRIDLGEGAFTDAGGMTGNISIASGARIENAIGGAGNDWIVGNAAANRLDGRGGTDTLVGGVGDDIYVVAHTGDRVSEYRGGGIDTVHSIANFVLEPGIENLALFGSASISGIGNATDNRLFGNAAANLLDGGAGADMIWGGAGNDWIKGGSGNDQLNGGEGVDAFLFDAPLHGSANVDRIFSFSADGDTIRLDRDIFAGIVQNGRLPASAFQAGTMAQDTTDRILYDARSGGIYYDSDGTGPAAATLFARMTPGTELTHADFVAYI